MSWMKTTCTGFLQRLQTARRPRRMELLETLNLGGKRQLMLVVCDGQRYLIGAGGDSVHSIEALKEPDTPNAAERSLWPTCAQDRGETDTRHLH